MNALGPVFATLLLGAFFRRLALPKAEFWALAEPFIYFILLPALLIHKLALADIGGFALLPLAAAIGFTLVLTSAALWLCKRFWRTSAASFTSLYQGGIRFNTYIGLACCAQLFGDQGVLIAAVLMAIMIPSLNLLCVLVFQISLHKTAFSWKKFTINLAKNPLILACFIGVILNISGIGLPLGSDQILKLLGQAALPLGLLAVGAALSPKVLLNHGYLIISNSLFKLVIMPVIAVMVAYLLDLPQLMASVLILFCALPTATSAYILARQLEGDADLMAALITGQTLLAFISLPWVLEYLLP